MEILTHEHINRLSSIPKDTVVALDLETTGFSPFDPGSKITVVGLAWDSSVVAFDTRDWNRVHWSKLFVCLSRLKLVAHNLLFDSTWLTHYSSRYGLNSLDHAYHACTYVMFKLASTEGWKGQSWSLDSANENILNTSTNNKRNLDELLAKHKLPKSKMPELANLETTSFMIYCANDAEACLRLYYLLQEQYDARFGHGALLDTASLWFNEIELLREQKLQGILIDREKVSTYHETLRKQIQDIERQFYNLPEVQALESDKRAAVLSELSAKEPEKKDLVNEHLAKEPPNRTAKGDISKRWEAWHLKLEELKTGPRYNKAWFAWNERMIAALKTRYVNINSLDDLKELFYKRLGFEPLKTTDSGDASLDNKALRFLGPIGQLLVQYRDVSKEEGYVRSCLENLNEENILRPSFKVLGTITGRIAGGGS